jgi:lipase (class 3)
VLMPSSDTRVVELRVHGIMGTRAETLVGAAAAVDVAGDGIGRIVRPADRLLRPGPGPVLQADSRFVPRTVEGYVWGAMTSGGAAKSVWALMFPFTLANVAHWMLPPIPNDNRWAASLGLVGRALLRLAALLLTVLFVTQVAVVSLDLLAAQCLAPGSPCLSIVPDWMRSLRGFRPMIGLIPALVVVLLLHQISAVSWRVSAPPMPSPVPGNRPQRMPGANLVADPDTPTLRSLHTVAALSILALLPVGGPFASPVVTAQWTVGLVLLVLAALGVLLLDDPTGASPHRAGRWLRLALGPITRRILLTASIVLVVGTAVAQNPLPTKLSGTDITIEGIAAVLIVVCVLFGLVLIPAALIARKAMWASDPHELRPWAGGWMSPIVLAIAALLGGGFGAGVAITVRKLLGSAEMDLPRGYEPVTLLWGVSAVLALTIGLVMGAVTAAHRWRAQRVGKTPPEVDLLHEGADDYSHAVAALAWRRGRFMRAHSHHLMLAIGAVLCSGAAVSIWMRLRDLGAPDWMRPFSAVGIFALGLLAANLVRIVYQAIRKPDTARTVGVLADLLCFWPREAHPIVPPCYALKVIPELAQRAAEHLTDRNTRVVITGHSHGSLIAAIAVSRLMETLPPGDRERVGLVTAGSPLQWAYPRAFPGVVPHSSLAELHGLLEGRWRALCRGTDPLGGAVTTWRRQVFDSKMIGVGFRPDGTSGPLSAAELRPSGALVLGGDHWLPDPALNAVPGLRWSPGVRRHGDYLADPEWDQAVAIAAGLIL